MVEHSNKNTVLEVFVTLNELSKMVWEKEKMDKQTQVRKSNKSTPPPPPAGRQAGTSARTLHTKKDKKNTRNLIMIILGIPVLAFKHFIKLGRILGTFIEWPILKCSLRCRCTQGFCPWI